jgi:hypothetical protein
MTELNARLEESNEELEAFSYSVSPTFGRHFGT